MTKQNSAPNTLCPENIQLHCSFVWKTPGRYHVVRDIFCHSRALPSEKFYHSVIFSGNRKIPISDAFFSENFLPGRSFSGKYLPESCHNITLSRWYRPVSLYLEKKQSATA